MLNQDGTRNLTQDEFDLLVATFKKWERKYKPVSLADNEHNANLIAASIKNRIIGGAPITAESVRDAVDGFVQRGHANGVVGILEFINPPSSAAPVATTLADEAPWLDEPMLKNVTSLAAVNQMTAAQIKVFGTSDARHQYDNHGKKIASLEEKFNERLAWLKLHPGVDLTETLGRIYGKPQPQVVRATKAEDPRITALRQRIDKELRGYTKWSINKRESLHQKLNEFLRDPSVQFRDRSRGGIELLRGLDAIERLMSDAIRDAVNGSVQ